MPTKLNETQLANRVQWVRDLLSGKFTQGRDAFKHRKEDGTVTHCCLAVACEQINPNARELTIGPGNSSSIGIVMSDRMAADDFGLASNDQAIAAGWNDGESLSFNRIADLIAYATEHTLLFEGVHKNAVPFDYAAEWLAQYN